MVEVLSMSLCSWSAHSKRFTRNRPGHHNTAVLSSGLHIASAETARDLIALQWYPRHDVYFKKFHTVWWGNNEEQQKVMNSIENI